ncbi:hypothetical protein D3C71_1791650 [compost metagenome]
MGVVVWIGRDGHFQLARKIRKITVQHEEAVHFVNQRFGVQQLVFIDSGQRVADNGARAIAASFKRI